MANIDILEEKHIDKIVDSLTKNPSIIKSYNSNFIPSHTPKITVDKKRERE